MLLVLIFASLLLVTKVHCISENDPDGTNEQLSVTSCNPGSPMRFNSVVISKEDGSPNYPIDVSYPVYVFTNFTNTSNMTLDNVVVSTSIKRYTHILGLGLWIGIPTFGLLDEMNGCYFGTNHICPIPVGVTVIRHHIDPTPYQPIVNLLSTSEPYRVKLSFKTGSTEIACLQLEGKIIK